MARGVERDPVGSAGGGNPYSYRTISTVWEPQPYGIAPPDEEPRRYGKRPPGKPIPPPGHTLTRGTVSADSAAGRYIACEDARIAKLRHPLAGTFTNNWHGRSWLEETWDTVRHMDPHEVLDAAGLLPVVGTLADLVNAGLYLVEGRYGEAGLSLGAAVPGIGDVGAAGKVIHRAAKWGMCDVLNIACFTAGTVVLTPQGPVPIESILPGDEVVSVDAETGAPVVAKVLGVSRGIAAEPCTEVTVDAGNRGAGGFGSEGLGSADRGAQDLETFTATDGHPFWVVSGERLDLRGDAEHVPLYEPLGTPRGRWVRAAELLPGDLVATRSGTATVVRVAPHARPEVVYNLHVEGTARYLVGACGVVVHNSPCSKAAAKTLAANRAAGKAAERQAARDLLAEGNEILGSQVTVQTSQGRRVVDHLIRTPDGQIVAVEVKSGGAVRTATQRAKDDAMGIWGIPVGENAPARLRGRTLSIPTIERRY